MVFTHDMSNWLNFSVDEDWLNENISWRDFGTGVRLGKLKREEKTSLVLYEAQSEVEVDAFMPHGHPGGEWKADPRPHHQSRDFPVRIHRKRRHEGHQPRRVQEGVVVKQNSCIARNGQHLPRGKPTQGDEHRSGKPWSEVEHEAFRPLNLDQDEKAP